jgi:hypothetical protein
MLQLRKNIASIRWSSGVEMHRLPSPIPSINMDGHQLVVTNQYHIITIIPVGNGPTTRL